MGNAAMTEDAFRGAVRARYGVQSRCAGSHLARVCPLGPARAWSPLSGRGRGEGPGCGCSAQTAPVALQLAEVEKIVLALEIIASRTETTSNSCRLRRVICARERS